MRVGRRRAPWFIQNERILLNPLVLYCVNNILVKINEMDKNKVITVEWVMTFYLYLKKSI